MSTYPFHGHDEGLVIDGPDTNFARRPMTPAELAARDPALKIAKDIYRHANFAGVCYAEIWRTIADAFAQADNERRVLRGGLELARDWLEGWGSAEPYLTQIQTILDTTSPSQPNGDA